MLIEKVLRLLGKSYTPDARLPSALVLQVVAQRGWWLLRGLVRLRRRVFLGGGVKIRGGGRIAFGRYVTIEPGCRIDGYAEPAVAIGARSKIGSWSVVSSTSHLSKYGKGLRIGANSGFGEYSFFGAAGGIEIGDDVIAGQYVSFHSENHVFADPAAKIRDQGVTSVGIRVGNDVWIGAKATFLDGSEVGDHSVVAAGAVVAGRFGPNSLIGGVPARLIRTIGADEATSQIGSEASPR